LLIAQKPLVWRAVKSSFPYLLSELTFTNAFPISEMSDILNRSLLAGAKKHDECAQVHMRMRNDSDYIAKLRPLVSDFETI
jgi:hypothetical protein